MKITVTQDDIDKGESCSSWHCPIAMAAKRAFLMDNDVRVSHSFIGVGPRCYYLPSIARGFIEAYDSNESVKPIEFELDLATAIEKKKKKTR